MPIFRVKSVKIYTGQKNLHKNSCGSRDKYQVCTHHSILVRIFGLKQHSVSMIWEFRQTFFQKYLWRKFLDFVLNFGLFKAIFCVWRKVFQMFKFSNLQTFKLSNLVLPALSTEHPHTASLLTATGNNKMWFIKLSKEYLILRLYPSRVLKPEQGVVVAWMLDMFE